MKKLVMVTAVFLISMAVGTALAAPFGSSEGELQQITKGNALFTELQNKDHGWSPIVGDGVWGWIVNGHKMDSTFDGGIEVKGLQPNSWYLVTLWAPEGTEAGNLLGSVGYFAKAGQEKTSWADIALFQTDEGSEAEIDLPYTTPVEDPVHGALTTPEFPPGDYVGGDGAWVVTVAIKYVGTGDSPDWRLVMSGGYAVGGTPDARDFNLYEWATIHFVVVDDDEE